MHGAVHLPSPAGSRPSVRRSLAIGLGLWVAAVGLAFPAQYLLTPTGQFGWGWGLYGVAALLAFVAVVLIDRSAPSPEAPADVTLEPWNAHPRRRLVAGALVALGVAASLSTVYWLQVRSAFAVATWVWLGALAAVVIGATLGARNPIRLGPLRPTRRQLAEGLLVVAILVVALALRLPELETIPRTVHNDEANVGLDARQILYGERPNIFGVGWYDVPSLSFAIPALVMWIFDDGLYGLRLASVIQGTLSVLLLYALTRRLFGVRSAAVAACLLAIAQWQIHYSRSGIHYMQAQFATLLVFYLLLRAFDSRRAVDFLLTGFAMGLCVGVYYPARLAPALAGLYALHRIVGERGFLRAHWLGLLAIVVGLLVFLAPMAVVFWQQPGAFTSRTTGVWIFTPGNLNHAFHTYRVDRVEDVLLIQVRHTLEAFNVSGESSLQYGHRAPLVDFWTGALLVLGVLVVTLRPHRSRYFLVASWLWLTLILGAVFTTDAPFSPRIIGVIPALMILPALVVDAGWRAAAGLLGKAGQYGSALVLSAILVLAFGANYRDYFDTHITRHQTAGFYDLLAAYVNRFNDAYRIYFIGGPNNSLEHENRRFLVPAIDGVDARTTPLSLPLEPIPAGKGAAFVIDHTAPDHRERVAQIKQVYPDGHQQIHANPHGFAQFTTYAVDHEQLVLANPRAVRD